MDILTKEQVEEFIQYVSGVTPCLYKEVKKLIGFPTIRGTFKAQLYIDDEDDCGYDAIKELSRFKYLIDEQYDIEYYGDEAGVKQLFLKIFVSTTDGSQWKVNYAYYDKKGLHETKEVLPCYT